MILFESERMYVRQLVMNDLDNYHRLIGDEEVMRYIRTAKTYEESRLFLKQVIDWYTVKPVNLRLAVIEKVTEAFIGSFAIIPVEHSTDTQLGYSFLKAYWGRGFATEITRAGMVYAFKNLALKEIFAITEVENVASQQVLVKSGFVWEKEYEGEGKKLFKYRAGRGDGD